ncbi:MAG: Hint domain-containing protein, partial [Gluconacetobacter diazotrophicus]|nr:Hint domain-containing protein [Gluconacetobacter diazotrophicus]
DDLIVAGTVTAMATDVSAERTIITLDTVATSGTTASVVFEFDGDYRSDTFTLQPLQDRFRQSYTGLDLDNSVPCFCPGTLIATPTGERPVEALRIGDPVRTAAGATRPILWIGRRTYPAHIAAGRTDLHPVLVLAGALGHGAPRRDLLLSPEHAVLVDDVLVPAALLVNGVSILREPPAGELSYLHVELEHHDLILAEGAPAESFVDDGSRALFDNAAEYAALYPDRRATPPAWCAPRIEHGDRLLAAQRRIDRLAALGGGHPAARLLGRLDDAGPGRLRGWAWCPDHPDAPVLLDLVSGDRVMGQVLADRFRADLLHAGIGDGCHGFETGLPSGAVGHLQLRRASDGARLPA